MASTAKPNPIPDTYRRVTPCLVVAGAAKALEFYAEVFEVTVGAAVGAALRSLDAGLAAVFQPSKERS